MLSSDMRSRQTMRPRVKMSVCGVRSTLGANESCAQLMDMEGRETPIRQHQQYVDVRGVRREGVR